MTNTIKQLKQQAYELLGLETTKQVKALFANYDLRCKSSWLKIIHDQQLNNEIACAEGLVAVELPDILKPLGGLRQATIPSEREMVNAVSGSSKICRDLTEEEFRARLAAR